MKNDELKRKLKDSINNNDHYLILKIKNGFYFQNNLYLLLLKNEILLKNFILFYFIGYTINLNHQIYFGCLYIFYFFNSIQIK